MRKLSLLAKRITSDRSWLFYNGEGSFDAILGLLLVLHSFLSLLVVPHITFSVNSSVVPSDHHWLAIPLWPLKLMCNVFGLLNYLYSDNGVLFVTKAKLSDPVVKLFDGSSMSNTIHRYLNRPWALDWPPPTSAQKDFWLCLNCSWYSYLGKAVWH